MVLHKFRVCSNSINMTYTSPRYNKIAAFFSQLRYSEYNVAPAETDAVCVGLSEVYEQRRTRLL